MKSALILLAITPIFSFQANAQSHSWNYSSSEGWNGACVTGLAQSPIAIATSVYDSSLDDLEIMWSKNDMKPYFNGHTVEVPYVNNSKVIFQGFELPLKQFHFHAPSEHTLNGKQYEMEIHFVHQNSQGKTLVVGVLVNQGKFNPSLQDVYDSRTNSAENLLPLGKSYYNYSGSLTTPPCTEGVTWIVMEEAIEASAAQIKYFQGFTHGSNNRSLQPINGRIIKTNEI